MKADDKYIVSLKNGVLTGNKTAGADKRRKFTTFYHFKARKDIEMMRKELYTTEQMQQIVDMVVQNLLPQGQKVPENLDTKERNAACRRTPN